MEPENIQIPFYAAVSDWEMHFADTQQSNMKTVNYCISKTTQLLFITMRSMFMGVRGRLIIILYPLSRSSLSSCYRNKW